VEFSFEGRETKGARDPFDAMLNLSYQAVLFPEAWKAILLYPTLDSTRTQVSSTQIGKSSLVLDLMEEFRQQVVDRVLIKLVSRRVVRADAILAVGREAGGGHILSKKVIEVNSLLERLNVVAIFNGRRGSLKSFTHPQTRTFTLG
jgi:CRISPR-associated protein Cas1